MFSLFHSIQQIKSVHTIDIDSLLTMIKTNAHKDDILRLHKMEYRCTEYDALKRTLPCITPHGCFHPTRANRNIQLFSGYMYFDVDKVAVGDDLEAYKNNILRKYSEYISVMGNSVGNRGLFFYIRIMNFEVINKNNFEAIFKYVKNKLFGDIITDTSAEGMSRCQIIPYSKQVYSYSGGGIVVPSEVYNIQKNTTIPISKKYGCIVSEHNFKPLSWKEANQKIIRKTQVEVIDPVYDIKPVLFIKLYIPRIIKDGRKHKIFRMMVNVIIHLNPDIDLHTVQSFIYWINKNRTGKLPMEHRNLLRTVENAYTQTKETGTVLFEFKTQWIHFNPQAGLSKAEKNRVSNQINGHLKKQDSIHKIQIAIQTLKGFDQKIYKKSVASCAELAYSTVRAHWEEVMTLQHKVCEEIEEKYNYRRPVCFN